MLLSIWTEKYTLTMFLNGIERNGQWIPDKAFFRRSWILFQCTSSENVYIDIAGITRYGISPAGTNSFAWLSLNSPTVRAYGTSFVVFDRWRINCITWGSEETYLEALLQTQTKPETGGSRRTLPRYWFISPGGCTRTMSLELNSIIPYMLWIQRRSIFVFLYFPGRSFESKKVP